MVGLWALGGAGRVALWGRAVLALQAFTLRMFVEKTAGNPCRFGQLGSFRLAATAHSGPAPTI